MACSIRPNLFSSLAPSSPPRLTAHAYATCFEAFDPPWWRATRSASSHMFCARYICTAPFQSLALTKCFSASLNEPPDSSWWARCWCVSFSRSLR